MDQFILVSGRVNGLKECRLGQKEPKMIKDNNYRNRKQERASKQKKQDLQ